MKICQAIPSLCESVAVFNTLEIPNLNGDCPDREGVCR